MVGLDCAGKTTILYKLKLGETIRIVPTIGFNVETVKHQNITWNIWDVGGGDKIRAIWRHYYEGSHAMIFIFDSQDKGRAELAAEELHRLSTEMAEYKMPLLVFANKQDSEFAMSMEEIHAILHPHDFKQKHWHIQPCSEITGEGLHEGLEWIGKIICPKK